MAGSTKTLVVKILNWNSVPVELNDIKWSMEDTNVSLVSGKFRLDGGKLLDYPQQLDEVDYIEILPSRSRVAIASGSFVTMRVAIQAPIDAQIRGGHLTVKTKYEVLQMKMHYETLVGSVSGKKLMFRSFPVC